MKNSIITFLLIIVLLPGCTDQNQSSERGKLIDSAKNVKIYRDKFGVAHVHGVTDADAVFGFAFAQAEDNFEQIEENFIRASGRASEVLGDKFFFDDWLNRALEIPKIAKQNYEQSPENIKDLCDAFVDGVNYYLQTHSSIKPKLFAKFEPWHVIALIKYLYFQRGFILSSSGLPRSSFENAFKFFTGSDNLSFVEPDMRKENRASQGSNSWAVMPKLTESGNAMLFINPHLPFFGPSQVYEGHVISDEGWNFTGYTRFGFPFPYVGFNDKLGWASTDNYADMTDVYTEKFLDPNHPRKYEYDGENRTAEMWIDSIRVKVGDEIQIRKIQFLKTHHGPVLGKDDEKFYSIKTAKLEDSGWLDEWYYMTKAQNLSEFKNAVAKLDMLFGNYLYADVEGNIFYVYNACVPKRDENFDWKNPVDGSTSATEWKGFHSMDELPQLLNPESGWIQNCNGTPLLSTSFGNPDAKNFPSYMITESDNYRHKRARQILSEVQNISFDEWSEKSYDKFVLLASEDIPQIITALEKMKGKNSIPEMVIEMFNDWNYASSTESIAMTLYVLWREEFGIKKEIKLDNPAEVFNSLKKVISDLENDWGTWKVPWGEINRLQRVASDGTGFDDNKTSFSSAGVPTWAGAMFTMWSNSVDNQIKRYSVGGNSYVSVVEFGKNVNARSLHVFGSSADPNSPFCTSQSERYLNGDYKIAWINLDEVKANAVESYKPGEKRK